MPDTNNSDLVANVGSVLLAVASNKVTQWHQDYCGMNCYWILGLITGNLFTGSERCK